MELLHNSKHFKALNISGEQMHTQLNKYTN